MFCFRHYDLLQMWMNAHVMITEGVTTSASTLWEHITVRAMLVIYWMSTIGLVTVTRKNNPVSSQIPKYTIQDVDFNIQSSTCVLWIHSLHRNFITLPPWCNIHSNANSREHCMNIRRKLSIINSTNKRVALFVIIHEHFCCCTLFVI